MIFIPEQGEGCTYDLLSPLDSLFKSCKFNTLFAHVAVEGITESSEMSTSRLEKRSVDGDTGILQPNSIYSICSCINKPETLLDGRFPITQKLLKPSLKETVSNRIRLEDPLEKDLFQFPIQVREDIYFLDEVTDLPLGWYNINSNILWISDILHIDEDAYKTMPRGAQLKVENKAKELLRNVLLVVREFRITGKIKSSMQISIGADPEFEVLDNSGKIIRADLLFPDDTHDAKTPIGTDGHADTGELRPQFATHPLKLMRNIKQLIRKINRNESLPTFARVCAGGGTKVTTGGHLHFGIPNMSPELKDALWTFVASHVLSHQTGIRTESHGLCNKDGGDITRRQAWGWEWRPLPSFIINEEITSAVLCTAYAIVKSYYIGKLPAYKGRATYEKLPLYESYKSYIDKFVELFVDDKSMVLEGRDILKEWRLSKVASTPSVTIASPSTFLREFFKPIVANLKSPVKIYIAFSTKETVATNRAPKEMHDRIRNFASFHFMDYVELTEVQQDERPSNPGAPGARNPMPLLTNAEEEPINEGGNILRNIDRNLLDLYSACILLPYTWSRTKNKTGLLEELKTIVRDIAIILGGGKR